MASRGIPFREAHEKVGQQLASIDKLAQEYNVTLDGILAKKNALGGTAPEQVKEAARKMAGRVG